MEAAQLVQAEFPYEVRTGDPKGLPLVVEPTAGQNAIEPLCECLRQNAAWVAHGRLPYRGPRQVAVCWA